MKEGIITYLQHSTAKVVSFYAIFKRRRIYKDVW
jgi:hypothetical protein